MVVWSGLVALTFLGAATPATAQMAPLEEVSVAYDLDSGLVSNRGTDRQVVYSTIVQVPGQAWMRLTFDEIRLGRAPIGGYPTLLRVTSLLDGGEQRLNARHVQEWRNSTAYFNGDAVLVEIVADAGAEPSRIRMTNLIANEVQATDSICGPLDDRLPSDDPRGCRARPAGCSAWLIDDENNCLLTAGHCTFSLTFVEFNVPFSNSGGGIVNSHPDDQYVIDSTSMRSNGGQGIGNDYAYFGTFENANTGLTAAAAQGAVYALADVAPPANGEIRITGYGTTGNGVPREWNQIQKTHVGPYVLSQGTTVGYQTDTTGGNSGSPVIFEGTGEAIGIHTHGGCSSGQNHGTAVQNSGLQNFLANPQGVCIPNVPETVFANGFAATFGDLQSGTVGDLAASDDARVVILQRAAPSPLLPVARIEVQGEAGYSDISEISITVEASATAVPPTVPQQVEMFDFDITGFELVDSRTATQSDSVVHVVITDDPGRFVQTGSRTTYARASWFEPGSVFFVGWGARIDQFIWGIAP
jgi:V8-like Glu-specific endopeptidase